jgi:acyl-CoA thioesterase-1
MTEAVMPLIDEVARQAGVKIVDLHTALSDKPQMFPDRIHPNAAGARAIAETVGAVISGKVTVGAAPPAKAP